MDSFSIFMAKYEDIWEIITHITTNIMENYIY